MKRIILIVLIIFIFVGCNKEKIYNEWVTKNDNKYYYDSNGTIVKNRTIEINGELFFISSVISPYGSSNFSETPSTISLASPLTTATTLGLP